MKNNLPHNKDKTRRYVRADMSFDPLKLTGGLTVANTLHSKIEPLVGAQTALIDSATKLAQIYEPAKGLMAQIDTLISPVAESVQLLGTNLAKVSKTALATGELLKAPTYDFLNSPMASALNVSVDAIKIGQGRIQSIMPDNMSITGLLGIGISNRVLQIGALNNIAIDSLQSSPTLFPIPKTDERISDLGEKIRILESKIVRLEEESENLFLTDITAKIITILENLDGDIANCFKGAMMTLLASNNKDMVGQAAESLTRVIERLPFKLSRKSVPSKVNKNNVRDAINNLKGISKEEIEHLVEQQFYFYKTLGSIRHRNKKIYNLYNFDHSRFKALAIQTEAFVYILLTFNNEK